MTNLALIILEGRFCEHEGSTHLELCSAEAYLVRGLLVSLITDAGVIFISSTSFTDS